MKKNLTLSFIFIFTMCFAGMSHAQTTQIKAIDEDLLTSDRIVLSLKFQNPDASKKFTWIIKLQSEFGPFDGGEVPAVDGAIIDIGNLQAETPYEIRLSMDTFNSYIPYSFMTPAPVSVGAITQKKPFTAVTVGSNFLLQSEKVSTYKVYNLLGSQVLSGQIDAGETKTVDAVSLPKGYYLISNTGDGNVTKLLLR